MRPVYDSPTTLIVSFSADAPTKSRDPVSICRATGRFIRRGALWRWAISDQAGLPVTCMRGS